MASSSQVFYKTGDDDWDSIQASNWFAQSFTTTVGFTATSVKLLMFKSGTPGTLTCRIETVDASGKPTGTILGQGTLAASGFTTNTAGAWVEIDITDCALSASTVYTVVCSGSGSGANNYIGWRKDSSTGYADGKRTGSSNGGLTWFTPSTTQDLLFDVWGQTVSYADLAGTIPIVLAVTGTLTKITYRGLAGTIALTLTLAGTLDRKYGAKARMSGVRRLVACGNNQLWYEDV